MSAHAIVKRLGETRETRAPRPRRAAAVPGKAIRRPRTEDFLKRTRAGMREAAAKIECGKFALRTLLEKLEQHPDFKKTARYGTHPGASRLNPTWWLHNCIHSVLYDVMLDDAARCLFDDAYNSDRYLKQWIADERRDLARNARKRRRAAAQEARARVTVAA